MRHSICVLVTAVVPLYLAGCNAVPSLDPPVDNDTETPDGSDTSDPTNGGSGGASNHELAGTWTDGFNSMTFDDDGKLLQIVSGLGEEYEFVVFDSGNVGVAIETETVEPGSNAVVRGSNTCMHASVNKSADQAFEVSLTCEGSISIEGDNSDPNRPQSWNTTTTNGYEWTNPNGDCWSVLYTVYQESTWDAWDILDAPGLPSFLCRAGAGTGPP